MQLKVFRTHPDAKLPSKAYEDDTGFDLFVAEDAEITVTPKAFSTGVKLIIPKGYWVKFREKSGKALQGICVHAGVVDNNYTGELKVIATAVEPLTLPKGSAICQFSLEQLLPAEIIEIDEKTFKADEKVKSRKEAGFGSTGR